MTATAPSHRRLLLLAVAGTVALATVVGAPSVLAQDGGESGNACLECHEDQGTALQDGPHMGIVAESSAFCTACHGDPARHLESMEATDITGPQALKSWTVEQKSGACLECHAKTWPEWNLADHAGEVSCWSCHESQAAHWAEPEQGTPAEQRSGARLCTHCHKGVAAEFRLEYHHPIEEGGVRCVDCHDVHGTTRFGDAAQAAVQACTRCHTEQDGPFLFEHPVVEEEGCTACHRPHGSWNRSLLVSAGLGICTSCHLQSNFPSVGNIPHDFRLNGGARCWDCHSDVHGSNTTPDLNPRGER